MSVSSQGKPRGIFQSILGRVTRESLGTEQRKDHVRIVNVGSPLADLDGYACIVASQQLPTITAKSAVLENCTGIEHFSDGDILRIDPSGQMTALYRKASRHNIIFATDRCNSLCLMCSQPPRNVDEGGKMTEHRRLIDLLDPEIAELAITGGEPTLLGDGFLELIQRCKERLPRTALHVLSNGRLFCNENLAERVASIGHTDLMIGVPLYGDTDDWHDYIVQARGAFWETMIGLQHLGRFGVPVEIRIVIHRLTVGRLLQLSEFIYRNLPFAAQVVFMGMEPIGLALPNIETVWIDPFDYQEELADATEYLAMRGVRVFIYNHALCVVPKRVWPYARQSISDWKNIYLPECGGCVARDRCAGFFASALNHHSAYITPILVL